MNPNVFGDPLNFPLTITKIYTIIQSIGISDMTYTLDIHAPHKMSFHIRYNI